MAIPSTAKAIAQIMDPADVLDFGATLTQGLATDTPPPFLLSTESVASFTLSLSAEAVAAGLMILSGAYKGQTYPAPTFAANVLTFWLAVDGGSQSSAMFAGNGATFGIELTVTTTANPARTKQRTLTVQVAQQ